MKVFLYLWLISTVIVQAQTVDVNITDAFRLGNSGMLRTHLAEEVELILPNVEGTFSLDQTVKHLDEFFNEMEILGFSILHEGSSPGGATYRIGNLSTKRKSFRCYILLDKSNPPLINEIRIESDE